ncbi:MAG TPA: glycosyltransferase [Amycolatopsis sp.]|nr:glycosyltransferase [Amycolatopsis sp.]
MKISMVSGHADPLAVPGGVDAGGRNLHVAELSAALSRQGHDVTVYARRDDPDQGETVSAAGYRVVHVPAGPARRLSQDELLPQMAEFGRFLAADWRREPPDVVHAHFWLSGLASVLAARGLDLPVVQTFRALGAVERRVLGAADTSPPERVRLERIIGRSVSRIAATCSNEVFELVRLGLPRARMSVVPCGVDLDHFTAHGAAAPGAGPRRRLVSVGRLVPRKGFGTTISALSRVPRTELVIAGGPGQDRLADDAEACRLRWLAGRAGVSDRVLLLGGVSRDDLPALLRSADVVVCTPWYEPFGMVPLEAMACGKPVVVTAVGGLTDSVVDGVTGAVVPPRRPDLLAPTLRRLLDDPALCEAYGVAGMDRARSRYPWDRIAADVLRVYEQALTEQPVKSAGVVQQA